MIPAEARLVDGESPAHQGLGLGEPVRSLKQLRQIVEANGDGGVVEAWRLQPQPGRIGLRGRWRS